MDSKATEEAKPQDKAQDKKAWAEMSDEEVEEPVQQEEQAVEQKEEVVPKKKIPQAKKGFKNDRGDYVVTSINIPDLRTNIKKTNENKTFVDSDSDSDEGYGDEEEEDTKEVKEEKEGRSPFYLQLFQIHIYNYIKLSV